MTPREMRTLYECGKSVAALLEAPVPILHPLQNLALKRPVRTDTSAEWGASPVNDGNRDTANIPGPGSHWVEATKWAMKILKQEGFCGPFQCSSGSSPEVLRYSKAHGLGKPVDYVYDEPSMEPNVLDSIKSRAWQNAQAGIDNMAAVDDEPALALIDYLQYPIVSSYFSTRAGMYTVWRECRRRGHHPFYYFQTPARNPRLHRLLCGFFLWQSGYAGAFPYAFQHGPEFMEGYYLDNVKLEIG